MLHFRAFIVSGLLVGCMTTVSLAADDTVRKTPTVQGTVTPSPFDMPHAKYEHGAYTLSYGSTAELEAFRTMVSRYAEAQRANAIGMAPRALGRGQTEPAAQLFRLPNDQLMPIALAAIKAQRTQGTLTRNVQSQQASAQGTAAMQPRTAGETGQAVQALGALPTPGGVSTALIGIELMLDDLLNRANSAASSALFAMRSHVAASIADMNVMFKNRMDEAFDRLSEEEQKILTQAQVLAAQADQTLRDITEQGFDNAADLACQTTADLANFNIGLPLPRIYPPDVLCLKDSGSIRDSGPQTERILTFRGVNMLPHDEYARVSIDVAAESFTSMSAGGAAISLVPLPGGINGRPGDLSLRGERIAQVTFDWPHNGITRRWLFGLKPYLVRALDVTLTPVIKGPVRRPKTQQCYVHAPGGSLGSREEYATCTVVVDDGWQVESCQESSPTTANGDAGIRNRLFSPGACTWELRAKSQGFWGAGAWYGFIGTAVMRRDDRLSGTTFASHAVLNQNQTSEVFEYPAALVPPEFTIDQGAWTWTVRYGDNEGRIHTFTESQPSNPLGVGALQNNRLTFRLF